MRYTLRQLDVFLAVAREENITRAAEHLAMSQSAASSALKDIETQFDIQLFDRIGKRLQLNELGRLVRPKAEALIAHGTELQELLLGKDDTGNLKVGATLTIGNYLCVNIMARYMEQHASAAVSLEVANTATIASKVENYELDIGLVEGELRHAELEVIPWRDDELVVFCNPEHSLAGKRALGDEDLVAASWIVREPGSGTRQAFDHAMRGLLPDLNLALELQHTEAIKRAVEAGLGIGCLSRIALDDAFRRGSLVELRVPQRDWQRKFYFVLHRQKYRSAGIERWMDYCRGF